MTGKRQLAGPLNTWKSDVCLLVGCLKSQQQASVSQGRICSDNFTCCHTEIEVADQTFYLTQAQYTDTGPTSPSADPITPSALQGSHWSANFSSHWYDSTPKKSRRKRDSNPGSSALEADALPLGQRGGLEKVMRKCLVVSALAAIPLLLCFQATALNITSLLYAYATDFPT